MEHKDRNHNHGNGFILGLIIGGVATVLFTTKKGREIVKEITEKGFEKIADLQEGIEETVELEEGGKGDYLAPMDRSVPLEDDKVKSTNFFISFSI